MHVPQEYFYPGISILSLHSDAHMQCELKPPRNVHVKAAEGRAAHTDKVTRFDNGFHSKRHRGRAILATRMVY